MTQDKSELTDKDLTQADGGMVTGMPERPTSKTIYNSKNDIVGSQSLINNSITYYPCSKCRKPMHSGWFGWYCDPCNNHEWEAKKEVWTGSVEALKAASL